MNVKTIEKGTVLIVDDNPTYLTLLSDYLDVSGFEVITADGGKSALEKARHVKPDIILLDVMMSEMDGFEVCRHLKNYSETQKIPVIFMTSLSDTENKVRGFEAGAVDYVAKPVQLEEVLARVTTHLTVQNLQKSLQIQNTYLLQEIVERKRIAKELYHHALHDALTGLPNRILFMEHLKRSIECSVQNEDYLFAVLFLDLDRFKVINDSLGHLVGDQLLVSVARRLEMSVRSYDMVARLGGDEFAILLDNIADIDEAKHIAGRIQNELASPVNLDTGNTGRQKVFTTASIGIITSASKYERPEDLLRDADMAMYRAKSRGKARYELFDASQHTEAVARLQLETDLWQAFERQEFVVHYQPIVSLASGQVTGVEALLRWQHPRYGLISPAEFIPLLEETGLIVSICEWQLQTVCTQTKAWHEAGHASLHLSVNVSPRQFQDQNLPQLIEMVLKETGLTAQVLELEINENIALNDISFPLTVLSELRAMGLQISIDDFGIGFSLSYLKHLPLDILKIDQSFVRDITSGGNGAAIITAVIAMAHSLNLKVIAEGVETEEQLAFLREQECSEIQGYLFSKPLPAEGLTKLLQEGRSL